MAGPGQDGGRLVGGVYAANSLGSIAGALVTSLVLIPHVGTQNTQRGLMIVSAAAALLALRAVVSAKAASGDGARPQPVRKFFAVAELAVAIALAGFFVYSLKPVPFELIAYGRDAHLTKGHGAVEIYRGEGINSTIAVSKLRDILQFHVSGKIEASSNLPDMRLERLLANIPAMLHPHPHSVLVVGFGAGVTAGSFKPYLDVTRLVICEIEPLIPKAIGPFFSDFNIDVLEDPSLEIVYDDARHFILTTDEKFDIITSDPIHPYVKGAATLYTQEYFEQVKAHLKPGGLVTQWVPLYESNVDVVQTEIATFFQVFPHGSVWFNTKAGEGYDVVLLGSEEPLVVNLDELDERMHRQDHEFARFYLAEVGIASPTDLLATYGGRADDFAPWLAKAEINRDANLRLQYLAGFVPLIDNRKKIYDAMFAYRKYPEGMFTGSPALRQQVRRALSLHPLGLNPGGGGP